MAIVVLDSIAEPQSLDQQKGAASSTTVMLYAKVESCGTTRTEIYRSERVIAKQGGERSKWWTPSKRLRTTRV